MAVCHLAERRTKNRPMPTPACDI